MPTVAIPPPNLGDDETTGEPLKGDNLTPLMYNSAPFNSKLFIMMSGSVS